MKYEKTKYNNDYNKTNYDRLNILVPKGKKQEIIEHYTKKGYSSLNTYVNTLINNDMAGEKEITIKDQAKAVIGDNHGIINM